MTEAEEQYEQDIKEGGDIHDSDYDSDELDELDDLYNNNIQSPNQTPQANDPPAEEIALNNGMPSVEEQIIYEQNTAYQESITNAPNFNGQEQEFYMNGDVAFQNTDVIPIPEDVSGTFDIAAANNEFTVPEMGMPTLDLNGLGGSTEQLDGIEIATRVLEMAFVG